MCLVALFHRAFTDTPLLVGANREELYARGGEPPRLLDGRLRVVAGVDPTAGGTWLGVNEHGLLVAVTNRRKTHLPLHPRSRGLLARELLLCPDASAAAALAERELATEQYAGCSFLCVDRGEAVGIQAGDRLSVQSLPPGVHVLANRDLNDPTDPRTQQAIAWLAERKQLDAVVALSTLRELCGVMALHGPEKGTVSSTLIALNADLTDSQYLHAQGPPDRTPYADYSHLLWSNGR